MQGMDYLGTKNTSMKKKTKTDNNSINLLNWFFYHLNWYSSLKMHRKLTICEGFFFNAYKLTNLTISDMFDFDEVYSKFFRNYL